MSGDTAYRIRHWGNGRFEHRAANGRSASAMSWIAVPTKHDGKGFLRLMQRDSTGAAYGCWILLLAVAAKCPVRGLLADEDGPLTVEDIALKAHVSAESMQQALTVLMSPEIGWIDQVAFTSEIVCAQPARSVQAERAPTEQNRTEQSPLTEDSLLRAEQRQSRLNGRTAKSDQQQHQISVFDGLAAEDLRDTPRLAEWLRSQAESDSPLIQSPQLEHLYDIVGAAEHALKKGRNPLAFFKTIVGKRDFDNLPGKAVERAKSRVEKYLRERNGASAK